MDRPEVLAQLRAWNYQIHDQPIAEAAIAVARDPSRPTNLRLLALETLVSYLGARLTGQVEFSPRLGAQPPAADIPDRVYILSRELATDANPAVARAAKNKWQQLTDVVPRLASLLPGTLTLVNVCGRKFRITNSSRFPPLAEQYQRRIRELACLDQPEMLQQLRRLPGSVDGIPPPFLDRLGHLADQVRVQVAGHDDLRLGGAQLVQQVAGLLRQHRQVAGVDAYGPQVGPRDRDRAPDPLADVVRVDQQRGLLAQGRHL